MWGSDAEGAIHNPPTDIVWRSQGTWGSGSNVITKLVNKAGEVRFIWDGTFFELIQYIVYLTVNVVTVGCLYTLETVSISKLGSLEIVVVVELPIKLLLQVYLL